MRNLRLISSICFGVMALTWLNPVRGQSTAEWLTSSGDAARDGWQKAASKITPMNVGRLQLLWKVKVPTKPMGMLSFREPLIVSGVKTAEGDPNVSHPGRRGKRRLTPSMRRAER